MSIVYYYAQEAVVILLQVYQGRTIDGALVAIKVQRPNLLPSVLRDVYILRLGVCIFLFAKTLPYLFI
jgi:predicted unusual protein kinase regulating ubiquinone biosynthesis (AarF/ABC1/UbiB family)